MLRTPVDGTRLHILTWLKQPGLVESGGATADAVAARFRMSGPVARTHLGLLTALGLLHVDRSDGPPRYRRDEVRIAEVARMIEKGWQHGW
ncbi:ArsR family transcriptional regulator [Streptomyces sp. H28]|uniref:ArsR family transcriptional regulator n=1 Tax=Streptomyces sp. H28 TaxID=2775865 RepID=UPI001785877A|nr:ArsR family transcriptional regulator [Streptomyces sp. H28]MBD9734461.1 ArsR family transcriptional regulator [Streptomyces sp. H28]